jgi:hypothetical protein
MASGTRDHRGWEIARKGWWQTHLCVEEDFDMSLVSISQATLLLLGWSLKYGLEVLILSTAQA